MVQFLIVSAKSTNQPSKMLKALKTFINNPNEDDRYLTTMDTSVSPSPSFSDSKSFFSMSSAASKPPKKVAADPVESVHMEVEDTVEEFDFESFHKNMKNQKAKSVQVHIFHVN